MRRVVLGMLLAVLALAPAAPAQETRGAIEGVVKDSLGGVLPGATVEAKSASVTLTAVTNERGVYRFPALEPGVYDITVSMDGFAPARQLAVNLRVGLLLKVDLALALATVTETVDVSARSVTIDVKQTTAATNLGADAIDRLPKGRDFLSIVALAPGANDESRSGGMSVDGASASENKFYLDGVDTTNLRTGLSATPVLTDFIQEVQVKSSGHAAEFGGATGGVISVISKSGSNTYQGEAGAYFNSSSLNGDLALNSTDLLTKQRATNARRVLRLKLSGVNEAETWTYDKDGYSRWDPHFQIGGPILKNRLWFWGGYTPQLENTERTVTFRASGLTDTFTSTETTQNIVGNVTWQVKPSIRARVSGQIQPYTQDGRLPAVDGTSNPAVQFADLGLEQKNYAATGTLDWVASNRLFFSGRVNYLMYDTKDVGVPNEIWYDFRGSNLQYETRPEMIQPYGYNSVPTNQARSKDRFWRYGASADASLFLNAAGQHALKAGIQFERIGNDVYDFEQQPHVYLYWDQSWTTLAGETARGQYGYWCWRSFGTRGLVTVDNIGLFLQDAWTVNNRLTVNLGIRTESETVPSYKPNLNGIDFSFADKLAPRAGFAYDVKGDGKWKVFGSWGMFYDVMKLELPRGAFGGDVYVMDYYALDTLDWNTLMVNGNAPGRFLEQVDYRIPSNDPEHPEAGGIDPNLKPFRQQELVFGVEHELTPRTAVSARYVHKQVDRAVEDVGIMVPGYGEVYWIANPGEGVATYIEKDTCPTCPALPKAQRDYDALELKLSRRFGNNWMFNGSYTLSRLYGNYPGLASSDEIARIAPNVTRLFDNLLMAFDEKGQPVYGRLNTDRPHQFKLSAAYQFPTKTLVSGVWRAASGIPESRTANMVSSTPVFYWGRMSDGRTPWLTLLDLNLVQDIPLGRRLRGQIGLNVLNVFDQKGITDVYRPATRQNVPVPLEEFFAGVDTEARIDALNILRDPRFLQANAWQPARDVRVNFKLVF
ncbi:MAG: hypothetical protein H6Q10_1201 [Acidobacteria bacterium]|nr:hypothetical protein [Acidobacteriota bacterium]